MADTDKNPIPNNVEGEGINVPERRIPAVEQEERIEQELSPEKKEAKEDAVGTHFNWKFFKKARIFLGHDVFIAMKRKSLGAFFIISLEMEW